MINRVQIDNEIFYLQNSEISLSDAQEALLRILRIQVELEPEGGISSSVLMRLLGLKVLAAYQFRLKNLIKKGYLKPRSIALQDLQSSIA